MWVAVTVRPITTAWRSEPRWPTRYAAITVLPCPGARAWRAPRTTAAARAKRPKPNVSSWRAARAVKACVTRSGTRARGDEGVPTPPLASPAGPVPPGRTRSVARRWSSGDWRRSSGYRVRRRLTLRTGTSLATRSTPSPAAVVSRHPSRSAKLVFEKLSLRSPGPPPVLARSSQPRRRVDSPACPGGKETSLERTRRASGRPSNARAAPAPRPGARRDRR